MSVTHTCTLDSFCIIGCVATFFLTIWCDWEYDLTRCNKIAIQATAQMAADKEAIGLSRIHTYQSKHWYSWTHCAMFNIKHMTRDLAIVNFLKFSYRTTQAIDFMYKKIHI